MNWTKSEETLMEVLLSADVQIACEFVYSGERLIEHSSSWFPSKFS